MLNELTDKQSALADRVAVLLTEAALDDELKERILAGMPRMPEPELVQLVRWLTDRNLAIAQLEHDLVVLMESQEKRWTDLAQEQERTAKMMAEEAADAVLAEEDLADILPPGQ